MEKGTLFWMIMLLGFLFWCFGLYRSTPEGRYGGVWGVLIFLAVAILGWATFGSAVK